VWLGEQRTDVLDARSGTTYRSGLLIHIKSDAHVHSQHSTKHCFTIRVTHVLRPHCVLY
jgi:hypothetical protein